MYIYFMRSDEPDFRHEFDNKRPMLSWFLKYKWQNGLVWLPFPTGIKPAPEVDDELYIVMDGTLLGVAYVTEAEHTSYAMSKPELCVYYDANVLSMPIKPTMIEYTFSGRVTHVDGSFDIETTTREVPKWLSNFLTEKQK